MISFHVQPYWPTMSSIDSAFVAIGGEGIVVI